jgi:uncharacterized protein (TIRG00374 family)
MMTEIKLAISGHASRHTIRTIITLAVLVLAGFIIVRQGYQLDWRTIWSRLETANLWLLALALLDFYGTLPLRTLRWRALLEGPRANATSRIAAPRELLDIMFRSWFVNAVTVARLGDVYRADLLNRATGAGRATTLGTIIAERLIDLAALATTLGGAALLAFHGQLPRELGTSSAAGLAIAVGGSVVVAATSRWRTLLERLVPSRFHDTLRQLTEGFAGSFGRLPFVVALSVAAWLLEGTTLFLVAAAVGVPLPLTGSITAALIGSLLTTIPLTPAGLGFTEVGMLLVLTRLGVDAGSAGAITLLYRLVSFWSLVVLGGVFMVARRVAAVPTGATA